MNNVAQKYDFPAKELDDLGVIGLYLFGSQAQGLGTSLCDIDIVFLEDPNVNFQLRYHVAKYGMSLYERNPRDFANFKERTMDEYADFAPLRRLFTESIFARIS